jgi:hypothetical protein
MRRHRVTHGSAVLVLSLVALIALAYPVPRELERRR